MKNVLSLLLLFVCFFYSCKKEVNHKIKYDVISFEKSDVGVYQLINHRKYDLKVLDNQFLLGEVTCTFIANNTIVIFDRIRQCIVLFSNEGAFIRTIGKKGKGKGEILEITDCKLNKSSNAIEIFDNRQKKMVMYNFEGEVINEKQSLFNFLSFVHTEEGFWVYSPFDRLGSSRCNLLLLSEDLRTVKGEYIKGSNFFDRKRYDDNFTILKDEVLFNYGLNDTIYSIKEGNVSPRIVVDFGTFKIPYDKVSKIQESNKYDREVYEKQPSCLGSIGNICANNKDLYFTFQDIKFGECNTYSCLYNDNETLFFNKLESNICYPFFNPIFYNDVLKMYLIYPCNCSELQLKNLNEELGVVVERDSNPIILTIYE